MLLAASAAFAQGGMVNNGANIIVESGAQLVIQGSYTNQSDGDENGIMNLDGTLKLTGNLINNVNGSNFISTNEYVGTVEFAGVGTQNVGGTSSTEFLFETVQVNAGSNVVMGAGHGAGIRDLLNLVEETSLFSVSDMDLILDVDCLFSGNGYVVVTDDGYFSQYPTEDTEIEYRISDGTNNFTTKITCGEDPEGNELKVKLNIKTVGGAISDKFWDIMGPENMDATLVFRLDKSAIAPKTLKSTTDVRFYDDIEEKYIRSSNAVISDEGTYYLITVNGVNKF